MPERDRTLEVHCRNCGARLVAWYDKEEDAGMKRKEVKVSAPDDPFKKDSFKGRSGAEMEQPRWFIPPCPYQAQLKVYRPLQKVTSIGYRPKCLFCRSSNPRNA